MRERILIVGIDTNIGLAIIRALGRNGLSVYGVAKNWGGIGIYSRFLEKGYILPDWKQDEEEGYFENIRKICKENRISYIAAISEKTLFLINRYKHKLEEDVKLLLPDSDKLNLVTDKKTTYEFAEKLGIPIPKVYQIYKLQDIDSLDIAYPLIIKSKGYVSGKYQEIGYRNKILTNEKELVSELKKYQNGFPLIQKYQEGYGIGVSLLMKDGEALAVFQHKRIHELDGGSVLAESLPVDPLLYKYSFNLLKALDWNGVAMVEWKYKNKDEFSFLEINGRFWGSLPLSIGCGVNFPYLLYLNFGKNILAKAKTYSTGVKFCILTGEIRYLIKNKDWKSVLNLFRGRTIWNCLSLADPLPGIMDIILAAKIQILRIFKILF